MPSAASQARNKKKKQKQKQKQQAQAAGAGTGAGGGSQHSSTTNDPYAARERFDDEGELLDDEDDGDPEGDLDADELVYEDEEDDEEYEYTHADGQQPGRVAAAFPAVPGATTGAHPGVAGSNTAATTQLHQEMLGTASALYSQIESAAAAALSGHLAGSNAAPPLTHLGGVGMGGMGEEDDAYWLSLPSHLRSFIRSALPLAAGLSSSSSPLSAASTGSRAGADLHFASTIKTGQGQGGQINLTPDQMAAAAAQLAQVVQNGWASTLAKEPVSGGRLPPLSTTTSSAGNATTTTTTTVPLGAFALPMPLHPHPDSPEAAAAFNAAAQAAAVQAAAQAGNMANPNNGTGSFPPPFPSLASLQASLQQLAQMHTGFGASIPGSPFTAPANGNGAPTSQQISQYPAAPNAGKEEEVHSGESKNSKKKKRKATINNPPPPIPLPLPPAFMTNGKVPCIA